MIARIEDILFAWQCHNSLQQYINKRKGEPKDGNIFFNASGAGMCMYKHVHKLNKTQPFDTPKSKRVTSLGSLIHEDFENAVNWFKENVGVGNDILINNGISPVNPKNIAIQTEETLTSDSFNVKSILDYIEIYPKEKVAIIVDYKSAKTAKFSLEFTARAEWQRNIVATASMNRENGQFTGVEMQLGTIGIIALEKYAHIIENVILVNTYYKKDDSMIRYKLVTGDEPREISKKELPTLHFNNINFATTKLFDACAMYWNQVHETINDPNYKPGDIGSPMESWECKWGAGQCGYLESCLELNPMLPIK
jgi:hypothetical protein